MPITSVNRSVTSEQMGKAKSREEDTLAGYVKRVIWDKRLTYRAIARRATENGHPLSHATVGEIVKGDPSKKFLTDTLEALAVGLEVSVDELLRRATNRTQVHKGPGDYERQLCDRLYEKFREATPETKAYMDRLIRSILRDITEE